MARKLPLAAVAVFAGLLAGCAAMTMTVPGQTRQTALGPVLTDATGRTLYTYDRDKPGVSACNIPCEMFWPPVVASADAKPSGAFTIIARDDGARQWAYKNRPLYGFFKDLDPGNVKGDGADGIWHVAKP